MDYRTYQKIRAYCWQDLSAYIDTHKRNAVGDLMMKLAGGEIGQIEHEHKAAMDLFQCRDLTPRENAAAHLLAVVSNHRAITWQREPIPPSGGEPAPPLEQAELEALTKQTDVATTEYAAFLPEPERAALLALLSETLKGVRNMNDIHLTQLRDIASEYLPAAQQARDNFKQWDKMRTLSPADYARKLCDAAIRAQCDATLPAVEKAAANLLEAVSMWQSYDPSDPELADIDPTEHRAQSMRRITETAETLATVTGRPMAHLMPADAPPAKGAPVQPANPGTPENNKQAKPRPIMTGKPSAEIIDAFKLEPAEAWREKLRHIDKAANSYKDALVQRGGRGKSSHAWNPAKFARCLENQKEKNYGQLYHALETHFPDWLQEYEALRETGS